MCSFSEFDIVINGDAMDMMDQSNAKIEFIPFFQTTNRVHTPRANIFCFKANKNLNFCRVFVAEMECRGVISIEGIVDVKGLLWMEEFGWMEQRCESSEWG